MVVATNQASLITPPVDEIKKLVALPLPEIKIRECFLKSLFNFCFFKLFCRTFTRALLVSPWKYFYIFECLQYVKVPIRSFFWSVSSCIRTEYRKIRTGKKLLIWTLSRSVTDISHKNRLFTYVMTFHRW